MGLFLHTLLLVPYHPWRISHAMHHAHTGHAERDEVFVPPTRASFNLPKHGDASIKKVSKRGEQLDELLEDAPAYRLYRLVIQQLGGWPAYLFKNVTSNKHYPAGTNHFLPSSALFKPHQAFDVLLSDAALLAMVGVLYTVCRQFAGWETFAKFYLVPYLFVNNWLVFITFLQHTDPSLPHYRGAEWNFARGALATMDRNMFGPIGPYVLHGICETHVAHHLSSKIPHYNAWEATDALKQFLGPHYNSTDENMLVSLWRNYRDCRFIEDEGDVLMFRDANGKTLRRVAFEQQAVDDSGIDVKAK